METKKEKHPHARAHTRTKLSYSRINNHNSFLVDTIIFPLNSFIQQQNHFFLIQPAQIHSNMVQLYTDTS